METAATATILLVRMNDVLDALKQLSGRTNRGVGAVRAHVR